MKGRIDENELLAWIEGDVTAERAEEIGAALASDPELLAFAERARSDRAALRAWGERQDTTAPAGLVEDAMAAAERRALLNSDEPSLRLAGSEADRPRPRAFPMGRVAAAAGVLLVAGAGLLMFPQVMGPATTSPGPGGPMTAESGEAASEETMERAQSRSEELARAGGDRATGVPGPLADARPVVGDADAGASAQRLSAPEGVDQGPSPLSGASRPATVDEVFRLAAAGRLGLHVSASSEADAEAGLGAAVGSSPEGVEWKSEGDGGWLVSFPVERRVIESTLSSLRSAGLEVEAVELDQAGPTAPDEEVLDLLQAGSILNQWTRRGTAPVRIVVDGE